MTVAGTIRIEQKKANFAGGRYEGDISIATNRRGGQGKYFYPNPYFSYEGSWADGQKHGRGRLSFEDGGYYEGNFERGEIVGEGERHWPDGSQYTGNFKDGEKHGYGCSRKADGTVYTGNWERNKYGGNGELKLANGDHYSGEFRAHKYHGRGSLTEATKGRSYEGAFESGLFEGAGELKHEEKGFSYSGQFRSGRMDGTGKGLDKSSGVAYDGVWEDDAPQHFADAWDLAPPGSVGLESYIPASELLKEEASNQLNQVVPDPKKDKGKQAAPKKGAAPVEEPEDVGPEIETFIGEPLPQVALRILTASESKSGKVTVTSESGRQFRVTMFKQRRVTSQEDPSGFEVLERPVNFGDRRLSFVDPLDAEAAAAAAAEAAKKPGKGPSPPPPPEEDEDAEPPSPGEPVLMGVVGLQGEAILGGGEEWFLPVHLQPAIYWLRVEDVTAFHPESMWKCFAPLEIPLRVKPRPESADAPPPKK